ncbi:Mu-like prophage I protein [Humidesulfovibrio mexicanus]|uniref:Mu-like prophage I protein n=1 Tax=Humidesulfovibrio mexicanus TaxID=147047 RepID=A0A238XLS7_9BACT|nr:phage protease [Humidesulfovibrio mexicanus]SNR59538.1 Mu-like prophage I protein [Humidesulfovibrio mexicanus]
MDKEFACCVDLGSTAPVFVQLLPAGPQINGVDGRRWVFDQAAVDQVLAAFARRNRSLVIDWEHSSQVRAEKGLEAPAAGWIVRLEARNGELWGQVEWTPRGAGQITRREYRFLSPVFLFDKNTGRIQELSGAGLTNSPNLNLVALNRAEHTIQATSLTEPELAICRALDIQQGDYAKTQLAQNRERTGTNTTGLSEIELAVCRNLGISPEQYITGKEHPNG